MTYLSAALLLAWLIYSPKIAIGLAVLCVTIALFYAAILPGYADSKVKRAFAAMVIIMSVLMVGVVARTTQTDDGPRYCSGVQC